MKQEQIAIVDAHRQIHQVSCIPSAVELVLKLHGVVDQDYYDQQQAWGNKSGSFGDYNGKEINGVKFTQSFFNDDSRIPALLALLAAELGAGRFPIISLATPQRLIGTSKVGVVVWQGYHMYLVSRTGEDFVGIAKWSPQPGKTGRETLLTTDLLAIPLQEWVRLMGGTDILTYAVP